MDHKDLCSRLSNFRRENHILQRAIVVGHVHAQCVVDADFHLGFVQATPSTLQRQRERQIGLFSKLESKQLNFRKQSIIRKIYIFLKQLHPHCGTWLGEKVAAVLAKICIISDARLKSGDNHCRRRLESHWRGQMPEKEVLTTSD
jgi:hypothetical protein